MGLVWSSPTPSLKTVVTPEIPSFSPVCYREGGKSALPACAAAGAVPETRRGYNPRREAEAPIMLCGAEALR